MRRFILLTCLVIVGCGSNDDGSGGAGAGSGGGRTGGAGGASGAAASGGSDAGRGGAGQSGAAARGGSGQSGGSGRTGGGGGIGAGMGAGAGGSGRGFGTIRLVPNIVAGTNTSEFSQIGAQALRVGSPSATTLLSLKYYVTSIQLCEELELAGSGFNNPRGCIDLYRNMGPDSPDYGEYTVSEAKDDNTPGRYIDLMSADGQAALRQPVTLQVPIAAASPANDDADGGVPGEPSGAGVYRYGLINFYRPIKVKAEFPIIGQPGQYFRTRAVTAIHSTPASGNGFNTDRVEIGDTLSGPTEETTYMLNNGGALFVFQKPFAITQADVDAQAEIKVDLVFNPENFGQAYDSQCANDTHASVCDPVNNVAIDMPYVRMNPVPRKAGQKTRKETYQLDYDANSQLRIELYYNDGDAAAGIQGVDIALVYDASVASASAPSGNTIASNFVTQTGTNLDDATVTLFDYQHQANLEGLRRRHNGTATVHCRFTGSICPSIGTEVSLNYTYQGDSVVSAD